MPFKPRPRRIVECDRSIISGPSASGPTLGELSETPGWAESIKAFAEGLPPDTDTTVTRLPETTNFPINASVRATLESVCAGLSDIYLQSIMSFKSDLRCMWSDKQLTSVANSIFDNHLPYTVTIQDHFQRIKRYTRAEPHIPSEGNMPKIGSIIDVNGEVGMLYMFQPLCCRDGCTDRRFTEGQKPVPLKAMGWAHVGTEDGFAPPDPVSSILRQCQSCQTDFEVLDFIMPTLEGESPVHLLFDPEGKAYTCGKTADDDIRVPSLESTSLEEAVTQS